MRVERKIVAWSTGLALTLALGACGGGEKESTGGDTAAPAAAEAAAPAAAPAAAGPTGTASVTGTVKYEGEVPNLPAVQMAADPACASKHSGPVANSMLELGPDKTLGNVFVYVKSGLPDAAWPAPTTPAVVDQNGCMYIPHVLGVMAGQPLEFRNSDGLLHNVHALPSVNQEFNIAMPAERTTADHKFDQAEGMFRVKCDVHPWMNAYIGVMKHPFFATTAADGKFTIANLPAGTYEVEVWHEKLGSQTQSVTVADGEAKTADFTLTRAAGG